MKTRQLITALLILSLLPPLAGASSLPATAAPPSVKSCLSTVLHRELYPAQPCETPR